MYFGRIDKNTPENCSINFLQKKFLRRFQVLEFFSTTRNDRIFHFSRALPRNHISINLCILVDYTRIHLKIAVSMSSKKVFSWALPATYNGMNLCIYFNYTRKHPKIAVTLSSIKVFCVGFGFSNFFRLLETTEFFFSFRALKKHYISMNS